MGSSLRRQFKRYCVPELSSQGAAAVHGALCSGTNSHTVPFFCIPTDNYLNSVLSHKQNVSWNTIMPDLKNKNKNLRKKEKHWNSVLKHTNFMIQLHWKEAQCLLLLTNEKLSHHSCICGSFSKYFFIHCTQNHMGQFKSFLSYLTSPSWSHWKQTQECLHSCSAAELRAMNPTKGSRRWSKKQCESKSSSSWQDSVLTEIHLKPKIRLGRQCPSAYL